MPDVGDIPVLALRIWRFPDRMRLWALLRSFDDPFSPRH